MFRHDDSLPFSPTQEQPTHAIRLVIPGGHYARMLVAVSIRVEKFNPRGAMWLFAGRAFPEREPLAERFAMMVTRRKVTTFYTGPTDRTLLPPHELQPGDYRVTLQYRAHDRARLELGGPNYTASAEGDAPLNLIWDGSQELCLAFGFDGSDWHKPVQHGWTWHDLNVVMH